MVESGNEEFPKSEVASSMETERMFDLSFHYLLLLRILIMTNDRSNRLTIKYNVNDDRDNRPKLFRDGSGTLNIGVTKGGESRANLVFTSQVPRLANEDVIVKLNAFLINVVDTNLNVNIATSKKNLLDLNASYKLPVFGTSASIKTNLVTDFYLTSDPVKSTQLNIDVKLDEGTRSYKSFSYVSDSKSRNDNTVLSYDSK